MRLKSKENLLKIFYLTATMAKATVNKAKIAISFIFQLSRKRSADEVNRSRILWSFILELPLALPHVKRISSGSDYIRWVLNVQ